MDYRIKVKPEDFKVREIVSLPVKEKGDFGVFILKKRGWNTVDLLKRISKQWSIPFYNISYGGKKDRHALTEQFITIKNPPKGILIEEQNFSFKLVGFSETAMQPKYIEGNDFTVVIRGISKADEELIFQSLENVRKNGFINYFDDQRFGSFDPKQGFIGEKIIKSHYNGALKIYLTHIHPEDKGQTKERKRLIFENWGDWQKCLTLAKTKIEKFTFKFLSENPKGYIEILRKISKEDMSMFFACYQSFLWNETVRRLLLSLIDSESILFHRGIAGDYIFFDIINKKTLDYLKKLKIPTASSNCNMPDRVVENIYSEILKDREIKPSMFNLKKIRQSFFKSVQRAVLVTPEKFEYKLEDDKFYLGKRQLILHFFLPRGSYATILIKRIFAKKKEE